MIDAPETKPDGNGVMFLWHRIGIGVAFEFLHDARDGLHGEITITRLSEGASLGGHIHWARLNLSSTTQRETLIKNLGKRTSDDGGRTPAYPWEELIEYACTVAARRQREGAEFVDLSTMPKPPRLTYLVDRILPAGQTSIIYSRGASGKSLLAMAIAIAVRTGIALPGGLRTAAPTGVLYLDYESDEEEQRLRLDWLARGMGLTSIPNIICRHQTRPLAADMTRLRSEVMRQGIGLVIVDSIAYALEGSALDADVVTSAFTALRSLSPLVSRLVVAHIPKVEKESKEASIYGSVFFENAGRSVWELRSTDEKDGFKMGLFHRKVNWGQKSSPIGLRFRFNDLAESVALSMLPLDGESELMMHASMTQQLLAALKSGARTANALAEDTDSPIDSVRRTLRRLEDRGELVSMNGHAKGEKVWGLSDVPRTG